MFTYLNDIALMERFRNQILWLKERDVDYARKALVDYDALLPWLNLKSEVKNVLQ